MCSRMVPQRKLSIFLCCVMFSMNCIFTFRRWQMSPYKNDATLPTYSISAILEIMELWKACRVCWPSSVEVALNFHRSAHALCQNHSCLLSRTLIMHPSELKVGYSMSHSLNNLACVFIRPPVLKDVKSIWVLGTKPSEMHIHAHYCYTALHLKFFFISNICS